mgnify:CR=1 FL=1
MIPDFKLVVDSKDITDLISSRLVSLNLTDESGFISDTLNICLDNRDNKIEVPPTGANISLYLGYKKNSTSIEGSKLYLMGSYMVDEIEMSSPPCVMNIVARGSDTFDKVNMGKIKALNNCSWHNKTYKDILQAIASKHNLKPMIDESYTELFAEHIDQTDESDIAFVNRIIEEIGGYVKVVNGFLCVGVKGSKTVPNGSLLPQIELNMTDLINYRVRITDRSKYLSVNVKYYDLSSGEEKSVTVGSGEPIYNLLGLYSSSDIAERVAKAKLKSISMGVYSLDCTLIGNPLIMAENIIKFSNTQSLLDGEWVIEQSSHELNSSGYLTTIHAIKSEG